MPAEEPNPYDELWARQFITDYENFTRLYYGERCGDFDKDCPCCAAWQRFDAEKAATLGNEWVNPKNHGELT